MLTHYVSSFDSKKVKYTYTINTNIKHILKNALNYEIMSNLNIQTTIL